MGLIKNYPELASSDSRKLVLNLIEAGLSAIKPDTVLNKNFGLLGDTLQISNKIYDLKNYDRLFLIGFGKGSATISKIIEQTLGPKLTKGFVIDTSEDRFEKIDYTIGTHPLPSEQNMNFTQKVIENMQGLTPRDLVLVVICGGGSVMFESPYNVSLSKLVEVNEALLRSGAEIMEVNTVRKHLSKTKGGGLVKILYPAKIVSLIFSDVPGNDLSFIASGPTVRDTTTVNDALTIYAKYNLQGLNLTNIDFTETPKEENIFENVDNILMLSNLTALNAMKVEAERWGISTTIYSDKFQSDSKTAAETLINNTPQKSILLAGGETTVKVNNPEGKGGRNQVLVLSGLFHMDANTIIASVDSDGWDNTPVAGAIGDSESFEKAKKVEINPQDYLDKDNSFLFFDSIADAIITDRLPSNVSDLMIVYKK